jgi:hypothetical protein
MSVRNDGKLLIRESFRTEGSVDAGHCRLIGFGRRMAGRIGSSENDGREKFRANCIDAMVNADNCSSRRRRQNRGRFSLEKGAIAGGLSSVTQQLCKDSLESSFLVSRGCQRL